MQFGVAHSNELVPVPKVKKNEYNEVVFFCRWDVQCLRWELHDWTSRLKAKYLSMSVFDDFIVSLSLL